MFNQSLRGLLEQVDTESVVTEVTMKEMAIVGIALHFPQAVDQHQFWNNLREGKDCVTDVPQHRKRDIEVYLQQCLSQEFLDAKFDQSGYLEDIDSFDYEFFGLSPKEASLMDPAHRLFLQCAWQAVEDAGYGDGRLSGTDTGVFLGYSASELYDYKRLIGELEPGSASLAAAGNIISMMASRVAYMMNLSGPSMMIDTACSSSLVALHEACKAIRGGDCSAAIVGGIRLNLVPVRREEKLGIESSDSRTRTFDDYADGSTLSEGVAAVVIKPLSQALRDKDSVYAVIKGSAVNQDGRSNGITAPNPDAHASVIEKAWKAAGIHPETLSYIETHGTGTKLGDPIEMEGLMKAFSKFTDRKQFCAIGSVKSNMGHLDSAAGMAGLIKAVLALKHEEIPPSLHFKRPNRKISFHRSPFHVNTVLSPWKKGREPRRCGVSSFGISGTNCHVVLEEAPLESKVIAGKEESTKNEEHIFTISAKSRYSLRKLAENYISWLNSNETVTFEKVCYSSCAGRDHYKYRLAVLATSKDQLMSKLQHSLDFLLELEGSEAIPTLDIFAGVVSGLERDHEQMSEKAELLVKEEAWQLEKLRQIAMLYTQGAVVKWAKLYKGEQRVETELPLYPFLRNRSWLEIPGKELNHSFFSTAEQLFVPEWKQVNQGSKLRIPHEVLVVFMDDGGIAEQYMQCHEGVREQWIKVTLGDFFMQTSEREFTVGPENEDYILLVEAICSLGVTGVIHFSSLNETLHGTKSGDIRNPLERGLYSLFRWVSALQSCKWKSALQMILIASKGYQVISSQVDIYSENAAFFGYGKTVAYDLPGSKCRSIDWDDSTDVQLLFTEIDHETDDYLCALRNNVRYVERITPFSSDSMAPVRESAFIRPGGTYVITGGVGIVGLQLAQELAANGAIRLILINRSPFPEKSSWAQIRYDFEMDRKNETMYKMIRLMEGIEMGGSEVVCIQADITEEFSLAHALGTIRERYGPIHGIIHAAGIVHNYEETQTPLTLEMLSEDMAPKVTGTRLLDKLTDQDPLDFFVLCSSVMTLTGGNNVGGYVAANAFLDAFTNERNARGKRTICLNWSTWEDTFFTSVLSVGDPAYTRLYGEYTLFKVMTNEHAGSYFRKALETSLPRLIVGQLNNGADIMNLLDTMAFKFSEDSIDSLLQVTNFEPKKWRKNEPVLENLSADITLMGRADGSYSDTERKMAGVWSHVLGYSKLNVRDNFYELGGDSISMMKLITVISTQFGAELKPTVFMENLSIEQMASWVAAQNVDSMSQGKSKVAVYPVAEPEPNSLTEPFDMTEVQRAYYLGRNDYFEMGGVSTHAYSELESSLNLARLNENFNQVIKRHPMLRCVVLPNGKQMIMDSVPEYKIEVEDIRVLDESGRQARIEQERSRMSHDVFRTERWPMFEIKAFRISEDAHYLCIGFDVLIADGLSMQIIEQDIMRIYHNQESESKPLLFTFRDYIGAYTIFRQSETYEASKNFWLGKLETFPEPPSIPLLQEANTVGKPTFQRLSTTLGVDDWESFKTLSSRNRVTPSAVFCAVYAEVLGRWSNQNRLAINLTVFNRYPFHEDIPYLVGDFTSLMLLGLEEEPGLDFWEQARYVNRTIAEALEHRHFDGTEMIRELSKVRGKPNAAMMPFVFTSLLSQDFRSGNVEENSPGDVKIRMSQTSQVYLDFQLTERNGVVELSWDYVTELFDELMMLDMFNTFRNRIGQIVACDGDIGIMKLPQGEDSLYTSYNATEKQWPQAVTLDGLFMQQAVQMSDQLAVIAGKETFTYGDLKELSQRFAYYLRLQGVSHGDFVGVMGHRKKETIALILGILVLGAAYVPVEPEYPKERREYMMGHSNCRCLVDSTEILDEVLQLEMSDQVDYLSVARPEDTAYVIYTSGSTGTPKGVMITHRAAANTIQDINERFSIGEEDRIAAISSFCFDLSVYDWFGALACGATVVMIEDRRDMPSVLKTIVQSKVTVWNTVPALMNALLDCCPPEQDNPLSQLRVIMLSGDWIPLALARTIRNRVPQAALYSLGGATEAAIWSIYYPVIDVPAEWKSVPYGIPLANQSWYVLDGEQRLCPLGVPGELYIGGLSLSSGYLYDDEKTNYSFINDHERGPLYRTGDYGVMRREGYIEFLGRRDHQVKIRGYRVELGEVENCLLQVDGVRDTVVIDKKDEAGQTYLAAYITCDNTLPKVEWQHVYATLSASLPGYMIPTRYAILEHLPLSANGKIERRQLPEPELATHNKEFVQPTTEIEKQILDLWRIVLGSENVSVKDHFFDVGGDSIQLMRVHAKIEELYPGMVNITDLFAYPTIESIADELLQRIHPKDYQTMAVLLPAETSRFLERLAEQSNVELYGIYLVAFLYLVADMNEDYRVTLISTNETGIETAHLLSLESLESVQEVVDELGHRLITKSLWVASESNKSTLVFAKAKAALKGEFSAVFRVSETGELQALYKESVTDDKMVKAWIERFRRLLQIMAEQL